MARPPRRCPVCTISNAGVCRPSGTAAFAVFEMGDGRRFPGLVEVATTRRRRVGGAAVRRKRGFMSDGGPPIPRYREYFRACLNLDGSGHLSPRFAYELVIRRRATGGRSERMTQLGKAGFDPQTQFPLAYRDVAARESRVGRRVSLSEFPKRFLRST